MFGLVRSTMGEMMFGTCATIAGHLFPKVKVICSFEDCCKFRRQLVQLMATMYILILKLKVERTQGTYVTPF